MRRTEKWEPKRHGNMLRRKVAGTEVKQKNTTTGSEFACFEVCHPVTF